MNCALLFVTVLYIITTSGVTSFHIKIIWSSKGIRVDPCASKTSCHECIQTPSCGWCSNPNPNFEDKSRCYQQNLYKFFPCGEEYAWNPNNYMQMTKNLHLSRPPSKFRAGNSGGYRSSSSSFTTPSSSVSEIVQIAPQHVNLKLRTNESYKFNMKYTRAEDFPVDLYYLVDLSKSMEDDKENLSKLANLLAESLRNITSNFRLGFGSFFSQVPSKNSEPMFGFLNHMSLSSNSARFLHMVNSAALSVNRDGAEGGLKALMQAIVCQSEIGWRENSRKIIVFSTDAGFNSSEDEKLGKLGSSDHGLCHLDSRNRYYMHSDLQDYPSISQLNLKVKENAFNIIFAVTEEQLPNYKQLSQQIEGSLVGMLSKYSSNVVKLVKQQYQQIFSSVEMKDNATSTIRMNYYSTCLNTSGSPKQTNKCENIKVGDVVQFEVEIKVLACPKDPKDWQQTLQIYPVGIHESLIVNLEMFCSCPCENPGHPDFTEKAPQCFGNGVYKCGICECEPDFFGRRCECAAGGLTDTYSCRPNNETETVCSGRGNCVCGHCDCEKRVNMEEVIYGKHCECDNFSCERHDDKICSGSDHGKCECGKCVCASSWTGPACNCPRSNDACYRHDIKNAEICSGHGECVCGQCVCQKTENVTYSGKYCEKCPTCHDRCPEFKDCVQCQMYKTGLLSNRECSDKCTFVPIAVRKAQADEDKGETQCTYYDEDNCRFAYIYYYGKHNRLLVRAEDERQCPPKYDQTTETAIQITSTKYYNEQEEVTESKSKKQQDKFDIFGEHVANELRMLSDPKYSHILAETKRKFYDALQHAENARILLDKTK